MWKIYAVCVRRICAFARGGCAELRILNGFPLFEIKKKVFQIG